MNAGGGLLLALRDAGRGGRRAAWPATPVGRPSVPAGPPLVRRAAGRPRGRAGRVGVALCLAGRDARSGTACRRLGRPGDAARSRRARRAAGAALAAAPPHAARPGPCSCVPGVPCARRRRHDGVRTGVASPPPSLPASVLAVYRSGRSAPRWPPRAAVSPDALRRRAPTRRQPSQCGR